MEKNNRNEKITKEIKEMAANFLIKENNRTSLITVTNCVVSNDGKKATVFITIMPQEKEQSALFFAKRNMGELREYIKKNTRIGNVPFINVEIDQGEKNRQKIDDLLRQK